MRSTKTRKSLKKGQENGQCGAMEDSRKNSNKRKPLMTPDQVCEAHAKKGAEVTIRNLDDDMVLIQGDAEAIRFLGDLLLAQANASDCGF